MAKHLIITIGIWTSRDETSGPSATWKEKMQNILGQIFYLCVGGVFARGRTFRFIKILADWL